MTKKITQNLLTKYIYNEASALEQMEIENAVRTDYELREQYHQLLEAKEALPKVSFSPPASIIDKILNYSNSTYLEAQL